MSEVIRLKEDEYAVIGATSLYQCVAKCRKWLEQQGEENLDQRFGKLPLPGTETFREELNSFLWTKGVDDLGMIYMRNLQIFPVYVRFGFTKFWIGTCFFDGCNIVKEAFTPLAHL